MSTKHTLRFYLVFAACCAVVLTGLSLLISLLPASPALNRSGGIVYTVPIFLTFWIYSLFPGDIPSFIGVAIPSALMFGQWFIVGLALAYLIRLKASR